ncbi:6-bladed beta-propeller [Parabacteroides sp. OttesenSCG-928-J18]|nr:6-bladed beta-propeller [Parabacteroides sp. OttesenSCG-928-J18]
MKLFLFSIILSVLSFPLQAQDLIHISLEKAKFGQVKAENIFEEIEIIPLETHKDALLNTQKTAYYVTDKYIIATAFLQKTYLFDRKTGAFLREVSGLGQGPDEYAGWIYHNYGLDEEHNILFATDSPQAEVWKCIDIETNKVASTIRRPLPGNNEESFVAYAPWLLQEGMYMSYCNNRSGKDKTRLVLYDKEGNVLKKYPNYMEYKREGSTSYPYNNGLFYSFNGQNFFKEYNYNDTVFCVTEENMSPHIVFDLGNKQPSYYHQNDADYNKEKYLINFVNESDSFVFFCFSYFTETTGLSGFVTGKNVSVHTGYYDKKSKQAYISSTSDFKKPGYLIDGIPVGFYPKYINKNKEVIAQIDPEELVEYRDKIAPKYKGRLQDIQEDDNPIIIIAQIK